MSAVQTMLPVFLYILKMGVGACVFTYFTVKLFQFCRARALTRVAHIARVLDLVVANQMPRILKTVLFFSSLLSIAVVLKSAGNREQLETRRKDIERQVIPYTLKQESRFFGKGWTVVSEPTDLILYGLFGMQSYRVSDSQGKSSERLLVSRKYSASHLKRKLVREPFYRSNHAVWLMHSDQKQIAAIVGDAKAFQSRLVAYTLGSSVLYLAFLTSVIVFLGCLPFFVVNRVYKQSLVAVLQGESRAEIVRGELKRPKSWLEKKFQSDIRLVESADEECDFVVFISKSMLKKKIQEGFVVDVLTPQTLAPVRVAMKLLRWCLSSKKDKAIGYVFIPKEMIHFKVKSPSRKLA